MTTDLHQFGEHFKEARLRRGLSLKEAAGDILSVPMLSQFEAGKKSISLTNFSRLLMSIGVDWSEFMKDYPGVRVSKYQEKLNQFFSDPKSTNITTYIEEFSPYYADYPEALVLLEDILTITREILAIGEQNKPTPNYALIDRLLESDTTNPLEFDYILAHLNQGNLKMEQILQLADNLISGLKIALNPTSFDFNVTSSSLTVLNRLIHYLSMAGYPLKAADLISQTKELMRPLGAGNRFVIQSLGLDFLQAYNLLRLKKEKEATQLAEKITTYLEANITYGHDPELHRWFIEAKGTFMNTFKNIRKEISEQD